MRGYAFDNVLADFSTFGRYALLKDQPALLLWDDVHLIKLLVSASYLNLGRYAFANAPAGPVTVG